MIGTTLGSYRILAKLGEGGMGEVYRARDSRLEREIALKVLPHAVTGDAVRLERFTREARAIAALNHPHIVTIFSTEEADGVRFFTMELVEGKTLDAVVPRNGLPLPRFLELALPIADALTAAHQKQITHRDLKPANVMVTSDGRVKVLDFGLARVGSALAADHTIDATRQVLTSEGTIVGTMPYMSPEQVEGKPLDHRTDLFSLGVMFHEMLTGARPFTGESSPQLMSSILRDVPSSASDLRPEIPEGLSRLIQRCLEKRPDDRVQTARDIYNELRHVQKQLESGAAKRSHPAPGAATSVSDSLWIAVLPFTVRGSDPDGEALASGLTEDITAGLTKFQGLSVVAQQSAASFRNSPLDARQIAERLNARYIMGGNVRKSASGVRIAAHLIDARSGAQLWTETYDRRLDESDIYAIQDDVTDRVVSTVADKTGVLARSLALATRDRPLDRLTARQLVYRCWGFEQRPTPALHAELRPALEAFLARHPDDAELCAELAASYIAEHGLLYNPLPDPLGRALRAARRGIELDPSNQRGWVVLAQACFFRHDEDGFLEAADQVLRLNPRNSNAVAWMGNLLTHKGEYDRGCQITERAMVLNSSHAGWYHFAPFNRHFARREYPDALRAARRVNVADFMWMHFAIAAAAGHLGLAADGRAAADALAALVPQLADAGDLRELVTRWYWDEEMIERLLDGVRRSKQPGTAPAPETAIGTRPPSSQSAVPVATPGASPTASAGSAQTDSDFGRATDAFVVSLLPFTSTAAGGDASDLADGLTEGLAVGLSRFSYLRVAQRRATPNEVTIGYVLHGSVRIAGGKVRVVTELTAAATGHSLWADTYDRALDRATLFDLQDELCGTIVATVADASGALVRAMAVAVREKPATALTPYEAVLRRLAYVTVMSREEHAQVRDALEAAVRTAPSYADAWASLAYVYCDEHAQGFNPRPEPLERARTAARRALELESSNQMAYLALARIAFFSRDASAFRAASERAIALNPLDTYTMGLLGAVTAHFGEWTAGLALCERAIALNPHHPGVFRMPMMHDCYRRRDYTAALAVLDRVNTPGYPYTVMMRAAIYAQLGRVEDAYAVWQELNTRHPDFVARLEEELRKWMSPDLVEHVLEGIAKARAGAPATVSTSRVESRASIAVLPFSDLSPEKDQDWFCDGIAEEILNALTQLPGLRVAARTSAFSFRDRGEELRTIAEKLGVSTVLQGSVRRAGDRIRVTVQLVDVTDGFQLWSERYDRELQDIFDVQDEIARAIAGRLKVTLTGGTGQRLVAKVTGNFEAYELLLKGRTLLTRRGRAVLDALACFERAVALDPNLAEAHALVGDAYRLLALYGIRPAVDTMTKARAAVERALAIDPTQVEALATLASIAAIYERDLATSIALTERALAHDPSHVRALAERSIGLAALDAPAPDLEQRVFQDVRRARALDPLNAWVVAVEAFDLALTGRYGEAVVVAKQALALDSENFTARWVSVLALAGDGQYDEALAAADAALQMSGRMPRILTEMAAIHAARGGRAAAEVIYDELRTRATTAYIGYAEQGAAAAAAGRLDEARALVAQAIEARDPYLVFWKLPAWAPFRQDAEGMALLQATGLMRRTER